MRILVRKIASSYLPASARRQLKETEYALKKLCISVLPKLTRDDIGEILTAKFRVKRGENLFVHASLDMINTDVSPLQLVDLLLELVGPRGSISVPTFPRYPAAEWMHMDVSFDVKRTPSGMGVFSERVRRFKGAMRSVHPTKSVATIGPIAEDVLSTHHLDIRPFGRQSPFYRLLAHDVKVVGMGVPMSYLSMVHTVEDCNSEAFPKHLHLSGTFKKACVLKENSIIEVQTLVHDLTIQAKANPEKFCLRYLERKQFSLYRHYLTPFFAVNGRALYDELCAQMTKGVTIYD